jgi:hypothetical protein
LNEASFYLIQTFTNLLITEFMYHPTGSTNYDADEFEFIELKNVASTNLELSGVRFTNGIGYTFPIGTVVGPGEFVVLVSNPAAFTNRYPAARFDGVYTGRLSNGGEKIALVHASGAPLVALTYSDRSPWPVAADGSGFSLVPVNPNLNPNPDEPLNWRASTSIGGSPGADDPPSAIGRIWINEVLTHTDPPELDAIELYNPNSTNVDIRYWYLTDQRAVPKKYQIRFQTVIPAGGYVVFTEADFNEYPGATNSFLLDSHGEEIYLYSADATGNLTGYSDGFSFGAAQNGVSFGRHTISTGEAHYPAQRGTNSLGLANLGPRIGPVVINEIQYHPALGDAEFIELKNVTNTPVKLYDPAYPTNTWRVAGLGYSFPQNSEIPPNGLLLLVGSDPGSFRSRHNVPAAVQVLGPFAGVLQDSGELLQLQRPDAPDLDTNTGTFFTPYIDVDAVRYNDKTPWPTNADGAGPSLERLNAAAYGNDPINWRASPGPASPGLENTGNRLPLVNAGGDRTVEGSVFPLAIALNGTVMDDGLPNPPGALTASWSQVSGPGAVTFGNANQLSTTVSFPGVGTYAVRLTASDGELSASDEAAFVIQRSPAAISLVRAGSVWKYLDNGSNQGTNWTARTFNDSSWASGRAQLGYGDGDEATVVSFGPDSANKYVTTYFRHTFAVTNAPTVTGLTVRLLRDDGAVVYLNGREIFRSNMPEGVINYLTLASGIVGGADESTFYPQQVDPSLLFNGNNVLGVEIHQQSSQTSSDISFDLELAGLAYPPNQPPTVNAGPDLTITLPNGATLAGMVTDDGLPIPPGQPAVTWSRVSGPGTVAFANPNAVTTTASFSAPGVYILRLAANDGAASASDDLTVTVNAAAPELRVDSIDFTGGAAPAVRIHFTAVAGQTYTVQYRNSLASGSWAKLADVPSQGTTRIVEIPDDGISVSTTRYYRIVSPQQ